MKARIILFGYEVGHRRYGGKEDIWRTYEVEIPNEVANFKGTNKTIRLEILGGEWITPPEDTNE